MCIREFGRRFSPRRPVHSSYTVKKFVFIEIKPTTLVMITNTTANNSTWATGKLQYICSKYTIPLIWSQVICMVKINITLLKSTMNKSTKYIIYTWRRFLGIGNEYKLCCKKKRKNRNLSHATALRFMNRMAANFSWMWEDLFFTSSSSRQTHQPSNPQMIKRIED